MKESLRRYFDQQVDRVLADAPPRVHELLDEVTMYVEDHPSRRVMQQMGVRSRRALCGLYTGIPLTERHVDTLGRAVRRHLPVPRRHPGHGPRPRGRIDEQELLRQIRITLLHELGHHHGLDEDDLEELGY
jgi:predicted Zn-dependent protease with MMP-like domain